ncbi:MAG: hypothetical protein EOM46_28025, partial [Gammaproteobacteria bacterium]|nr:hypothetical protein [Gammaproteobacteria bacterium]
MYEQNTLRPFCRELLKNLMRITDAQVGAIYFLSEQKNRFEPFESIGAKQDALSGFGVSEKEGEFGAALATKKIQHLTDIPPDVQVVFSAVSGTYKAREIITIPIADGNEIVSMISIAAIKRFSPMSVRLINGLFNEITARLNAVLASEKVSEFSLKLQRKYDRII